MLLKNLEGKKHYSRLNLIELLSWSISTRKVYQHLTGNIL